MENFIKVKSLEHLIELMSEQGGFHHEFFICLNGGGRSSKYLDFDGKHFSITNEIDGTKQKLLPKNLFNRKLTNIGYAIENGSFYAYAY